MLEVAANLCASEAGCAALGAPVEAMLERYLGARHKELTRGVAARAAKQPKRKQNGRSLRILLATS